MRKVSALTILLTLYQLMQSKGFGVGERRGFLKYQNYVFVINSSFTLLFFKFPIRIKIP